MKLERCKKGHFYDSTSIKFCPYCENTVNKTQDLLETDEEKGTVAYIPIKIVPVVGWLICIEGIEKGKDYRLVDKRNFIGSTEDMDVCILDKKIEKNDNFIITYNEKQRVFVISPGQAGNIVYLNKKAVYETTQLENYSLIEIGDTKLVFVKFCGEHFVWNM